MKKTKLIGLGVCALALGAVAGAVSARHALETKADGTEINVYFKDAGWWATDGARTGTHLWKDGGEASTAWPGTVMTKIATVEERGIWKATIDTSVYDRLIFTRYGAKDSSDWGAKSVEIDLGDFDAEKPLYDISGVTEPVWGDPGVVGTWTAYEEPEPVTDVRTFKFSNTGNWASVNYYTWDAGDQPKTAWPGEALEAGEDGLFSVDIDVSVYTKVIFNDGGTNQTPNINLAGVASGTIFQADGTVVDPGEDPEPDVRNVKFKNTKGWETVNYYTWGDGGYKTAWPGDSLEIDEEGICSVDIDVAKYTQVIFTNGLDGDDNKTPNIDISDVVSGTIFQADGSVWVPEEEKTYSVNIDGAAHELALNEEAVLAENQKAEYYFNTVLGKDNVLVFFEGENELNDVLGLDDGSNTVATVVDEHKVIKTHNATEGEVGIYLKTWNDGGYSVYVGGFELGPTGFFLLTESGEWDPAKGIVSDGESGLNVATFINVELEKGEEFTIGKFYDGNRDGEGLWQYDAGWGDVDSEHSDAIANFGDAENYNHIKVLVGGSYSIYVNAEHKVFLNEYQVTDDDRNAVANFIATYITEQAKDPKPGDTCEAKYNAAKTALEALTEVQQKLFRTDEAYAAAYATYLYWEARVTGTTSYNVSGLSNGNTALVVTISVLAAGAAIAGAMIYFSRKRKAE